MVVKGTLVPHMIKRQLRPVIAEVETMIITPTYNIVFEPQEKPEYVVVQIHLPDIVCHSCSSLGNWSRRSIGFRAQSTITGRQG
jgi:hypothetical protein